MTPTERAQIRDLVARNGILEVEVRRLKAALAAEKKRQPDIELVRKNACLRGLLAASYTKRRKVVDEARRLHGILVSHGIEVMP